MENTEIDFDTVANELKQYTCTHLSHDEIVIGLKAMQQRDRHWKNHSRFIVQLCGGKHGKLNKRLETILEENTEYSRSQLYNFLAAGKVLFDMPESEIDMIDCSINEFLRKNDIAKSIEVFDVKKIGHYKLDYWNDTMYIYSGHIGSKYGDWIFFSTYGEIENDTAEFFTKEKELDNKNVTMTYVALKGEEYKIFKFDINEKSLVIKSKK